MVKICVVFLFLPTFLSLFPKTTVRWCWALVKVTSIVKTVRWKHSRIKNYCFCCVDLELSVGQNYRRLKGSLIEFIVDQKCCDFWCSGSPIRWWFSLTKVLSAGSTIWWLLHAAVIPSNGGLNWWYFHFLVVLFVGESNWRLFRLTLVTTHGNSMKWFI